MIVGRHQLLARLVATQHHCLSMSNKSLSPVTSFRRTRNKSAIRWPCQLQLQLYYHGTDSIDVDGGADEDKVLGFKNTSSSSYNVGRKDWSLSSSIYYILNKIHIGNMHDNNIDKARSMLSIVSKWHNGQGATLAEAILGRLYKEQTDGQNVNVIIDTEMYNICMNAWNKSGVDGKQVVEKVESILDTMETRYYNGNYYHTYPQARPDRISYNCLINAYTKCDEEDYSDKVEAVLEKMNALSENAAASSSPDDREYGLLVHPDTTTYNSITNFYASRKNDSQAAQRCEDLLMIQSELSNESNNIQMDTTSFNIVLKAWSNSGQGIDGAQRAESLLQMMKKLHNNGHENVKPDTYSYSTVFGAYSKVNPEDASTAVDRVMVLLDELEGSYISSTDNINSCYNSAANAIVKNGVEDAVVKVQELMMRMKNMDAVPNNYLITSLIEAYALDGSDDSISKGKEILVEMMDSPEPELKPNSVPFNILLNATLKRNKVQLAENVLSTMEKIGGDARPDVSSYNMVISALSRSSDKDAEQKALDYLRNMLKSYREGYEKARPDSFVFNCIISMLSRSKQPWSDNVIYRTLMSMESQQKRGNASVIVDTITYNMVIGKLAKTPSKDNAKKVMNILKSMEEKSVTTDIITYTSVLKLQDIVNPGYAAAIASRYLERVLSSNERNVQVDYIGLKTLLIALSRSSKREHAMLARRTWDWIEQSDKANMLDSKLCNLVLISYSRVNDTKAIEEALTFLSERIRRYKNGEATILPSVIGFSTTLVSLSTANRIADIIRLLEIMTILNVKADEKCYESILRSLSNTKAKEAIHRYREKEDNAARH